MKMNLKNIWEDLSSGHFFKKDVFDERNLCSPFRDWMILLGGSLLILGLFLASGATLYFSISEEEYVSAETSRLSRSNSEILSSLEKILTTYKERRAHFDDLLEKSTAPVSIPDPSR